MEEDLKINVLTRGWMLLSVACIWRHDLAPSWFPKVCIWHNPEYCQDPRHHVVLHARRGEGSPVQTLTPTSAALAFPAGVQHLRRWRP